MKTPRRCSLFPPEPSCGVRVIMKQLIWIFGVVAALAGGGCLGNWSDEDLVFRLAIPERDALKLRVPGVEEVQESIQKSSSLTQGLNRPCEDIARNDLTCTTRKVAHHLNALTDMLLGLVEKITSSNPTQRKEGVRVWGPFAADGATYRFEMRRDDAVGPGGFSYCLHGSKGRRIWPLVDRNVRCGKDVDGFYEVLSGSFLPDPENGSVKTGVGSILLMSGKIRERSLSRDSTLQGRFEFDYDNRSRKSVSIKMMDIKDEGTGLPTEATYSYLQQPDLSGEIRLKVLMQLGCSGLFECEETTVETLELYGQWTASRASRVDALGSGGDLERSVKGWECTNDGLELVARHYDWDPDRDMGEETLCPFSGATF